jgi:hypothetical protein
VSDYHDEFEEVKELRKEVARLKDKLIDEMEDWRVEAKAPTTAHAICLAALKAVGK